MLKKKLGILSLSEHSLDTTAITGSQGSFAINETGKDENQYFIKALLFDRNLILYAKSFPKDAPYQDLRDAFDNVKTYPHRTPYYITDLGTFEITSISMDKYGTVSILLHNEDYDAAINVSSKDELTDMFGPIKLTDIIRLRLYSDVDAADNY